MQLVIKDKTYNVKFGVKFVRSLDKAYPIEQQGLKFGMALSAKIPELYAKNIASLADVIYHGTVTESPRPSLVDVETFVEEAKKSHLPILATTLSQNSKDYRELARLENFALVMGNEGQGISSFMTDQADQLVHISMKGQAESLNVAIAAGILMFYLS